MKQIIGHSSEVAVCFCWYILSGKEFFFFFLQSWCWLFEHGGKRDCWVAILVLAFNECLWSIVRVCGRHSVFCLGSWKSGLFSSWSRPVCCLCSFLKILFRCYNVSCVFIFYQFSSLEYEVLFYWVKSKTMFLAELVGTCKTHIEET